MKRFIWVLLISISLGVGNAFAINWTNNAGDGLWRTAGNWDAGIPGPIDTAKINKVPGPTIDSNTAAVCRFLAVGDGAPGGLTMTGGTLNVSSDWSWTFIAYSPSDVGTFTMSGGTVTTSSFFYVGFQGTGTLTMNGGTMNIGGVFGIGYGEDFGTTGKGTVNLNGGTINVASTNPTNLNINTNGFSRLDITGGILILAGDRTSLISGYKTNGCLTGYGLPDNVIYDYNSTTPGKTTVWAVTEPPKIAGTWTTLPLEAYGIDGNSIIGDAGYPALYNITTDSLTAVGNLPVADRVALQGIDGDRIVGSYGDMFWMRGFLHETAGWTPLDFPVPSNTFANGIDGNNIVGSYGTNNMLGYASSQHGFIYNLNNQSWTALDKPGANITRLNDIDGSTIIGFTDSNAVLYNMNTQSWTIIDMPGMYLTDLHGISGDNIVGSYWVSEASNPHGFVYNITAQRWITLDMPGAVWTCMWGIDGDNIVGCYEDGSGRHGFLFKFSPADLNKDNKVNMLDYAILASQWQQAPTVPSADIAPSGGDGIVDFRDLGVMADEWLDGA